MNNRRPIELELREIVVGKYSLILRYEYFAMPRDNLVRPQLYPVRESVIYSSHYYQDALQIAQTYQRTLHVPLRNYVKGD